MSEALPAVNGTIARIGFVGHVKAGCAQESVTRLAATPAAAANAARLVNNLPPGRYDEARSECLNLQREQRIEVMYAH